MQRDKRPQMILGHSMLTREGQSVANPPFVHKFASRRGTKYVYDVSTQEIVKVQEPLYDVIEFYGRTSRQDIADSLSSKHDRETVNAACDEIERGRRQGIFRPNPRATMTTPACPECIEELKSSSSGKLILNITQNCNCRCIYCAFSGLYPLNRIHRNVSMDETTAREAILLFLAMNKERSELNVSFYGGEPMLEFDTIRSLIAFAKQHSNGKKILFHVDTNGTILTDEMADYVVANDIHLQVSLDGPREIHDRYRRLVNGGATFDIIMQNLRKLQTRSEDYYRQNIGFSATVSPPYKLYAINDFFNSTAVPNLHVSVNFVDSNDTSFYERYSNPTSDEPTLTEQIGVLRDNYIDARIDGWQPTLIEKSLFEKTIVTIHTRKRGLDRPFISFPPNGICVPVVRRFYVETDGSIFPCERVNGAYRCGSVSEGVPQEQIFSLIKAYIRNSERFCVDCWAQQLCGLCFASSCRGGGYDAEKKRHTCEIERRHLSRAMSTYVSVMEENAAAYDFVNDMIFD
jgi:uncharacterized protein